MRIEWSTSKTCLSLQNIGCARRAGVRWLSKVVNLRPARDYTISTEDGDGTDLTNDGKVDFNDLKELAENWLWGQ